VDTPLLTKNAPIGKSIYKGNALGESSEERRALKGRSRCGGYSFIQKVLTLGMFLMPLAFLAGGNAIGAPLLMQAQTIQWGPQSVVDVFVSIYKNRLVYQVCVTRHWAPKPRPAGIACKDVSLFVSDQAGYSYALSPLDGETRFTQIESTQGGDSEEAAFILKSATPIRPKAVRLTWHGLTQSITLRLAR
jgi:hypothetical protein